MTASRIVEFHAVLKQSGRGIRVADFRDCERRPRTNTVVGDGVNVASRIHSLAPPGGICISSSVYDEIRNKPGIRAKDLGERKLKNVARRMRLYQLVADDAHFISEPHQRPTRSALFASAGVLAVIAVGFAITELREITRNALRARAIGLLPADSIGHKKAPRSGREI